MAWSVETGDWSGEDPGLGRVRQASSRLRSLPGNPMAGGMEWIGLILVVGWLGFAVWSWFQPETPSPASAEDTERDRQIGAMIGALGGGVEEAAIARYAISRLEEDLGRKATLHEIGIAIGAATSLRK